MEKTFLAIWGIGYVSVTDTATVGEHTLDWFSVDLGYDASVRIALDNLVIGECLNLSDTSSVHNIIRIK